MRSVEEIEEHIKKVDERIQSKRALLNKHPTDFGLLSSLRQFQDIKKDLKHELAEVKAYKLIEVI